MPLSNTSLPRYGPLLLLLALLLPGLSRPVHAHEIPVDVTVRAFLKPEGNTLRMLIRVPLGAMRDMNLPIRGPGFIVFGQEEEHIYDAAEIWLANYLRLYENDQLLGDERIAMARVSLPSDQSFRTYEGAFAHVHGPRISPAIDLIWDQALLDVLIEYPIQSAESDFSIEPLLAHLGIRTNTILHFLPPSGAERVFQYSGNPGLVRLDPGWFHAAFTFVELGFFHILEGLDHLLFIFCLVIPFRRLRPLLVVVTSFTVAHSITLIASAMGLAPRALWFPPLIETLIALSIVYMAVENIVGANVQRRWLVAFGFGLVHGFGFSFLLAESLQFAGAHLLTSLLAFNVGVEFGQILVLLLAIPVLELLFRKVVQERMGTIILSALVAHTAWHWMLDRGGDLAQYEFQAPVVNAAFLAITMRWLMLLLIVSGVAWGMYEAFGKLLGRTPRPEVEA
ncbi:MAG TPA: HupE/UreJ family protein [Longimicrobiaceae bacterium]|nr:HupE/UreJ family protein [Longimicrobiaceae bacterium]